MGRRTSDWAAQMSQAPMCDSRRIFINLGCHLTVGVTNMV